MLKLNHVLFGSDCLLLFNNYKLIIIDLTKNEMARLKYCVKKIALLFNLMVCPFLSEYFSYVMRKGIYFG